MTITNDKLLQSAQTICFLGIGGSGMRGLAALLAEQGKQISGTDTNYNAIKDDVVLNKYILAEEDAADHLIKQADLIIYSDSLSTDHALRHLAKKLNKPTLAYNEIVGALATHYETTIAIAGTHGKSSTTAFLAHILIQAGYNPTALLGATVVDWPLGNARLGDKKYFIVEADEYRNHFLALQPQYIVLTTIDYDHPDFFSSAEAVSQSYQAFINQLPNDGSLIINDTLRKQHPEITWPTHTVIAPAMTDQIPVTIPGQHMQNNAQLAVSLAVQLGIDENKARASLATFPGLGRRFEHLGQINSMEMISDYGHHPTEIEATLRSARNAYPNQRILAIIEPHMEERLATFFKEYVSALAKQCDGVLVCPIYRARQSGQTQHTSHELTAALTKEQQKADELASFEELSAKLHQLSGQFDIAIAFSAGELDGRLRQLTVNNH